MLTEDEIIEVIVGAQLRHEETHRRARHFITLALLATLEARDGTWEEPEHYIEQALFWQDASARAFRMIQSMRSLLENT